MTECPFCAASAADVSFMESPRFRAVINVAPILPGHSLVVPKRHVESLLALSDEEVAEMVNLSRRAVALLTRVYGSDGFDWTIQESEAAGQSVPHLHLHLIPRKAGDLPDPGDWYPRLIEYRDRARLTFDEMKQMAQSLRDDIPGRRKNMREIHVTIGQVKRDIVKLVDQVTRRRERVVLTDRGRPKAVLISLEDYERIKREESLGDRLARWQAWEAESDKLAADILQRRGGEPLDLDKLLWQDRADLEARSDRIVSDH